MTYLGVLLTFIAPPLLALVFWVPQDVWRWLFKRGPRPDLLPYQLILLHVGIALVYTTPWDNYLVATGVWWYNPALVTGLRLWYVPVEEYTFFVLQTLLNGLWTAWLLRRLPAKPLQEQPHLRLWGSLALAAAVVLSSLPLFLGWKPGNYLALILVWALLPILVQFAFGGDILLARWRVLAAGFSLPTVYLWVVDALAIQSGTWMIDPQQTTGLMVGPLPAEEMVFFLATNLILTFGVSLMAAPESHARARTWLKAHSKHPGEPGIEQG